jgi:hypothetical protein
LVARPALPAKPLGDTWVSAAASLRPEVTGFTAVRSSLGTSTSQSSVGGSSRASLQESRASLQETRPPMPWSASSPTSTGPWASVRPRRSAARPRRRRLRVGHPVHSCRQLQQRVRLRRLLLVHRPIACSPASVRERRHIPLRRPLRPRRRCDHRGEGPSSLSERTECLETARWPVRDGARLASATAVPLGRSTRVESPLRDTRGEPVARTTRLRGTPLVRPPQAVSPRLRTETP